MIYRSSRLNYSFIEVQSIEYLVEGDYAVIGSGTGADIFLTDEYVSPKHLKLTFSDETYTVTNISKDKKAVINNRYMSSVPIGKGDTISFFGKSYTFTAKPYLWGLGVFGSFVDDQGRRHSFMSPLRKYIRLSNAFPGDEGKELLNNYYLEIDFKSRMINVFYDKSIILAAVVLFLLAVSLWRYCFDNKKLSAAKTILLFALLLVLLSFSLLMRNGYDTYLKSIDYRSYDYEYLQLNNQSEVFSSQAYQYDTDLRLTIGFTRFKLRVNRDQEMTTLHLEPENNRFFVSSDKHNAIAQSHTVTGYTLPFLPDSGLLPVTQKGQFSRIGDEKLSYTLSVDTICNHFRKYYGFLLLFFIINAVLLVFSRVFRFDYQYIWFFSFILLQGMILLNQYSFFNPFEQHIYHNFVRNLILGVAFCAIIYLFVNFRWFMEIESSIARTPSWGLGNRLKHRLLRVAEWLPFLILGVLIVFYLLELFIGMLFLSLLMIIFIFFFKRIEDIKTRGNLYLLKIGSTDTQPNEPVRSRSTGIIERLVNWRDEGKEGSVGLKYSTYKALMLLIFFFLLLQTIKGDELGFNFLGTNYQFLELFKIIIVFVVIIGYLNHLEGESGKSRFNPMLTWLTLIPVFLMLSLGIADFSPVIIFLAVFYFHWSYHLFSLRHKYRYYILLAPLFLFAGILLIPDFIWFIIILTLFFIVMLFFKVSKIKNKVFIGLTVVIFFSVIGLILLLIFDIIQLPLMGKLVRFHYWSNIWDQGNYQFHRSLNFLQGGDSLPDMRYVPVLKDDMVFSLYLNRFGFWGFILGFIGPMILFLHKAIFFEKYQESHKNWICIQILFLSLLFFIQTFIVLSNVTGLLPIMGQPAPGMSYSASNLIFFFFGIFFIISKLKKELLTS
jgi:cell division protein FtsW (lipid II flippase)